MPKTDEDLLGATKLPVHNCSRHEMINIGARLFAFTLVELLHDLTPKKGWRVCDVLEIIDRRNAEFEAKGEHNLCASHDFCDSNVALCTTMRILLGFKEVWKSPDDSFEDAVWKLAKETGFGRIYRGLMNDDQPEPSDE